MGNNYGNSALRFSKCGANAQFLRDNFRRKWIYEYFREYDQHLFYLDADSFGPKNDLFLKFYQS